MFFAFLIVLGRPVHLPNIRSGLDADTILIHIPG
jgi:hypothetical protein